MSWALVKNGTVERIINTPTNITVNGVTHPRSIFSNWSADQLAAIGVLPYSEEKVDNRYYWSGNVTYSVGPTAVTGSYNGTGRDVDSLKDGMLAEVKTKAAAKLAPTDWMVIRAAEGGTAVSEEVSTYRAAVRSHSNDLETAINALSDLAAVIAFDNKAFVEVRKVKHDTENEDGTTTTTYGPETEENNRTIRGVDAGWPTDPLAEVDPAFVSLTAA